MTKTTHATKTMRQYYLAQIIFWGGFLLLNLVFTRVYFNQISPLAVAIYVLLSALLFVASHGLRHLFRGRARTWSVLKLSLHLAWILPCAAMAVQALLFVIINAGLWIFTVNTDGVPRATVGGFVGYTMNTGIILVLWCTAYLLRAEFVKRRQTEIAHWKLQTEIKDAELQFLRSQISSHFIFNALNNLRSLIREDAERARAGLNDLAVLLRGLMHIDPAKQVKLRDELEWVRGYLALEALQFEHRLKTAFDIDETLLDQELPPLILQTLVENAVKHGIAARRDGGIISVIAKRKSDTRWQLMVINPCAEQAATHQGHGIGIRNAQQRLMLAYADQATLALHVDEVVTATVEMPL